MDSSNTAKDEEIYKYKKNIDRSLRAWGFKYGSSEWYHKYYEVMMWLSQFEVSEIAFAIEIVKQIQYYNDIRLTEIIKKLVVHLRNTLDRNFSNTFFFPLGASSAASGSIFLYKFKQLLRAPESAFPQTSVYEYLDKNATLVFFDDIVGSGNQATEYFNNNLKDCNAYCIYVSMLGFEKGVYKLINKNLYNQIIIGERLPNSAMAFSDESSIFPPDVKEKIHSLCFKYGQLLYSHPLGYDDSQSLIVFSHNTPNNTLPIISIVSKITIAKQFNLCHNTA